MKKIRVLVVDDSIMFREILARGLNGDPALEVVGTAGDAFEARDKIVELEPDVMTLDVEMPKMSGIEFLRKLLPQYPMRVVVVSAVDGAVFDALNAGAVDFVAKPDYRNNQGIDYLIRELIAKIKIASTAKVKVVPQSYPRNSIGGGGYSKLSSIIALGASTGGTEATFSILKMLPKDMPGILIVQHMPPVFTKLYADRLNNACELEVKEAENMDKVLPGRVLIAPGDYHMRLKKVRDSLVVECYQGEKVNNHCPSVDVLFYSVAQHFGKNALGVILTGMGSDGARGLLAMKQAGAGTIGQDEQSCVVYGMPRVAYEIGAVERQASVPEIGGLLHAWTLKR